MNANLRVALLSIAYMIVLIGGPIWAMTSPLPWSIAIGVGSLAVLVTLLRLIIRTPRRAKARSAVVDDDPDPWAVIAANARQLATDELIAMHNDMTAYANAGTAVQLERVIRSAIEAELIDRGVHLCPCGAPVPGGIHTTTCPESS
ncbi:hypothetical protein [Nonomuraea sp. KM90]|uniref:hypothetical protein n=1 Tax=Nonomuraea sp. KM90 TaxID=3457428 RepID=UPI003FCCACF8